VSESTAPENNVATAEPEDPFKTRFSEVELICPKCTASWSPPVAMMVNAETDPQAKEGVLRGTMHRVRCPRCKEHEFMIDQIWEWYDPEEGLLIQFRPKWEYKAGGEEEVYLKRLEALVLKYADHDIRVDISFGYEDAIEKYFGGQEAVDAAHARAAQERAEGRAYGSIVAEEAAARAAKKSDKETT
jgi:hypothetical protein